MYVVYNGPILYKNIIVAKASTLKSLNLIQLAGNLQVFKKLIILNRAPQRLHGKIPSLIFEGIRHSPS